VLGRRQGAPTALCCGPDQPRLDEYLLVVDLGVGMLATPLSHDERDLRDAGAKDETTTHHPRWLLVRRVGDPPAGVLIVRVISSPAVSVAFNR
jgi:hypothetical protein